jgi:hypothetical protein
MRNLWPEQFDLAAVKSTKSLLGEQASFLAKLTGGIVDAEVVEVGYMDAKFRGLPTNGEFLYSFELVGRFVDNYRFRVFYFWHDIGLYPVTFKLDDQVVAELGWSPDGLISARDEENAEEIIGMVFGSLRLKRVVGSIMSLSK